MSRIAYVNGRYVPHLDAAVHIEDRGYQFADGVYEVIAVHAGALVDEDGHLDRLARSLKALHMAWPMARGPLRVIMRQVIRRNRIDSGYLYMQVTRGVARRNHPFPSGVRSALVMTARHAPPFDAAAAGRGVDVITVPDLRWARRDIKSTALLPNVLARQQAVEAGAYEAWMVDGDGLVTEGTASNAWIVTADGTLVTRHVDTAILEGITRRAVADLAAAQGLRMVERPFTVTEAKAAAEAFVTGTTSLVKPVVRIDGTDVGDGRPGPLTTRLLAWYGEHMAGQGSAV